MQNQNRTTLILAAVLSLSAPLVSAAPALSQAKEAPAVAIPQPGVPEVVSVKGKFIRVAYNDEGFVIVGSMSPNRAIGGEWMLLDFGATLLGKTPDYTLTRDAISLEMPDGNTIPMASVLEQRGGGTEALQWRAIRENPAMAYFPTFASEPCSIGFFSALDSQRMPFDEVELSIHRGCYGRIFFHLPGGIALGQHWLNVKFAASVVRVPFTILTPAEEQYVQEHLEEIQRQVDQAFQPKS